MNILKLTPSCKDYLWGGSRLRSDFGIKSDLNPLAEAWVLSCHPDGQSYMQDGGLCDRPPGLPWHRLREV